MVRVLILLTLLSLGMAYLAARSYQQSKLAQQWAEHVALQASTQRAQSTWLQNLDDWLQLPVQTPEDCFLPPCVLATQAIETFIHQPVAFWQKNHFVSVVVDPMSGHKTYAIVEAMPSDNLGRLLRGNFIVLNESGMQLRFQLVAQQNTGQVSLRYIKR